MKLQGISSTVQLNRFLFIWNTFWNRKGVLWQLLYGEGRLAENFYIGGTSVYALSQIIWHKPLGDLDLFIANPTPKQKEILEVLSSQSTIVSYPNTSSYNIKLIHPVNKDAILNIMPVKKMPKHLSYYKKQGLYLPYAGVEDTNMAKTSYIKETPHWSSIKAIQSRFKDFFFFDAVRALNFNWLTDKIEEEKFQLTTMEMHELLHKDDGN